MNDLKQPFVLRQSANGPQDSSPFGQLTVSKKHLYGPFKFLADFTRYDTNGIEITMWCTNLNQTNRYASTLDLEIIQ